MRILYLGLPLGAEVLRRAGFAPTIACIGHLDAPGRRRARRLLQGAGTLLLGAPSLEDDEVVRTLASAGCDVILSWFWPKKIPARVLGLAPRGAFGVHPSLLPRWRGPDPFFWSIRRGDRETGVTLHRLEPEYDTGRIVEQRAVAIEDDDDGWSLAKKLDRPSLALLVSCAQRLARGEVLEGAPQDEGRATEAPQTVEEDLALDFDCAAEELERWVRAARPEPGARAFLGEALVTFLEVAVEDGVEVPGGLEIGEAWIAGGEVRIRCGRGVLRVDRVRDEDDDGEEKDGEALAALLR
jgi:methionyl-tRNA formyltransferase